MTYIHTRPPFSENEISTLVAKIETGGTHIIDGKILSILVQMAYYCGLKKTELLNLRIEDVADRRGKVRNIIRIGFKEMDISNILQRTLQMHLRYLRDKKYMMDRTSPLFPEKDKGKYSPRQIGYHLKKYLPDRTGLEKIRQSGICRFYDELMGAGKTPEECLKKTSSLARCSERETRGILTARIQQTGRKISLHWRYYDAIENFRRRDFRSEKDVMSAAEKLRNRIDKEYRLDDTEKENMKGMIQDITALKLDSLDD